MRKEYTYHSKEEKLEIVKRYLSGESPKALGKELCISDGNIRKWKRQYLSDGESALENRKKPGNPLSKYERRKELTREEQLEYQVELLKRELMRKEAEVVRLKNPSNWKEAVPEESNSANLCARPAADRTTFCRGALQLIQGISFGVLQVAGTKRPTKLL